MDLEFFKKQVLRELYQSLYFYTDEREETDTEYIYTITIGVDYIPEEYSLYFDKKTKKLTKFQKNT